MLIRASGVALGLSLALALGAGAADARPDGGTAGDVEASLKTAQKKKKKKKRKKRKKKKKRRASTPLARLGGWAVDAESSAAVSAGAMVGKETLPESAAVVEVEARARGELARGRWRLRAPLGAAHRETAGASLAETRGLAGVDLRWRRGPELRITGGGRIAAYHRPDWPDQYQPLAGGELATTNRYSHWDREVFAKVAGIPLRHQHVIGRYSYTVLDYAEDPSFDAIDEPTHLVPGDRTRHELDLSWRHFGRGFKIGGAAELFIEDYGFAFSRDAGTGLTHATPGGPAPNPLQQFWGVEPAITGELELAGGAVELEASYGFEIVQDTFEGYYSFTGHHPEVALTWAVSPTLELGAAGELKWRRYGANSYAMGGSHPPLTFGDRRVDHRGKARLDGRRKLSAHWSVVVEAALKIRRTNFPDYVPGVFPASRDYDIRWSYENYSAMAGVEHTL